MMKKWLLLLALYPGLAMAEKPSCEVSAMKANIAIEPLQVRPRIDEADYGMVIVNCPKGKAWTLEASSVEPGGVVVLHGTNNAQITSHLSITDTGQPLGRQSNGESVNGIGTGLDQVVPIRVRVLSNGLPRSDTYQINIKVNLYF